MIRINRHTGYCGGSIFSVNVSNDHVFGCKAGRAGRIYNYILFASPHRPCRCLSNDKSTLCDWQIRDNISVGLRALIQNLKRIFFN
ncbi:hypothetical protein FMEAI12_7030004 [Parafrankia sp. Ea1.12]|nr:hypothetical protein FMEAI12_7030004 [Parafrankia sp. Ea1.12]